jgi:cell division protein FtsL
MSNNDNNWYDVIVKNDVSEALSKLEKRVSDLEKENTDLKDQIKDLANQNLRTINKMLEAEISLERTKNMLLRNHIPFSFSVSGILNKKL